MLGAGGHDCLGQYEASGDGPGPSGVEGWLYFLNDAPGYVRQGADEAGRVTGSWLFDPDGTVLAGPEGLVSHLICGGVYDWSTGLVYRDGRYFDPVLGIWLALMPLLVFQAWKGRRGRRGMPWLVLVLCLVGVGGSLVGCGGDTPSSSKCIPVPTLDHLDYEIVDNSMPIPYEEEGSWWVAFGEVSPRDIILEGIVFYANVVDEPDLRGNLHFKQHVKGGRDMALSDNTTARNWLDTWHRDGPDPYDAYGTYYPIPRSEDAITFDNPRQKLENLRDSPPTSVYPTYIHIDEEFVMFVFWSWQKDGIADRALLGYVEWFWKADATLGPDGKWTLDNPGTRDVTKVTTNNNTPGEPLAIPPGHASVLPDPNTWK